MILRLVAHDGGADGPEGQSVELGLAADAIPAVGEAAEGAAQSRMQ